MTTGTRTPQFYVLPKIHKEHKETVPIGYPGCPSYLPVNLMQKIYQGLLIKFCSPMSKILVLMLKVLQIFCASCKNVPYIPKKAF